MRRVRRSMRFGLVIALWSGLSLVHASALPRSTSGDAASNVVDTQNLQLQLQRLQEAANAQPTETAPTAAQQTMPVGPAGVPAATGATGDVAAANREQSDVQDEAFAGMTQTLLPLNPAQIQLLRTMHTASQRAASLDSGTPPKPTFTSVIANLSPGATPPVIRLGAGFVTSIVFLDSTGAPWPVASYSVGNPQAYNIQWDKTGNVLLVQAITAYRGGNIAVILRGLDTPVMLQFVPGQASMDVRADVRVPGLGPKAEVSVEGLPSTASPVLLGLLDGIPPEGSQPLSTGLCQDCLWMYKSKMYLRTRFTVLSPAWIATLSSIDGTRVYEMQPSSVVLVSREGKMLTMKISGF